MSSDNLVIFEEDVSAMDRELARFLDESGSDCALLVHRDGQLVAKRGHTQRLDTTALAALAAGAFASTREIARLVGEPEFSVLFHQGVEEHIHVSLIADHMMLVAIFDDRTTIGMVRLYASEAAPRLREVANRMQARGFSGPGGLPARAPEGSLFAPDSSLVSEGRDERPAT